MYCKKCGNYIEDDSDFCKYCGCKVTESNENKKDEVNASGGNHMQAYTSTYVDGSKVAKVVFCVVNLGIILALMGLLLFSKLFGLNDESKEELMRELWGNYGWGYESLYDYDTNTIKTATDSTDMWKEILNGSKEVSDGDLFIFLASTLLFVVSIIAVIIIFMYTVYRCVSNVKNMESNIFFSRLFGYLVMGVCIVCLIWVYGYNLIMKYVDGYEWQCQTMVYVIGFLSFIYASSIRTFYELLCGKKKEKQLQSEN